MIAAPAAVLLDRDGTINVKAPEGEYVTRPEELVLLAGAAEAIARLNAAGVSVAVVTNQRGIALGRMTETDLERVHARLDELLAARGAAIDVYRHCPHEKDTCDCRKPRDGMLRSAAAFLGVAPHETVMIGDARSDVRAGIAAGARTIRLGTEPDDEADLLAPDLRAAVDAILPRPG